MAASLSERARRRMTRIEPGGLFTSDWMDAVFIHFRTPIDRLQPHVPFRLEPFRGMAYVSLVAFTMRRLRPTIARTILSPPLRPIATHPFLNLRTYVRHRGDPGIYFLAEWLPNRLSVALGPRTYGLPYRLGQVQYRHDPSRTLEGEVVAPDRTRLAYRAMMAMASPMRIAPPGSLDAFLLERYAAFTHRRGVDRRFRVWHEPWEARPLNIKLLDTSLLRSTGDWIDHAELMGGHYSPGVQDVWMGRPVRLRPRDEEGLADDRIDGDVE